LFLRPTLESSFFLKSPCRVMLQILISPTLLRRNLQLCVAFFFFFFLLFPVLQSAHCLRVPLPLPYVFLVSFLCATFSRPTSSLFPFSPSVQASSFGRGSGTPGWPGSPPDACVYCRRGRGLEIRPPTSLPNFFFRLVLSFLFYGFPLLSP